MPLSLTRTAVQWRITDKDTGGKSCWMDVSRKGKIEQGRRRVAGYLYEESESVHGRANSLNIAPTWQNLLAHS